MRLVALAGLSTRGGEDPEAPWGESDGIAADREKLMAEWEEVVEAIEACS
jgi:hypothetical protein